MLDSWFETLRIGIWGVMLGPKLYNILLNRLVSCYKISDTINNENITL